MNIDNRMIELMKPIDKQIMMCDDHKDLLKLACAMMQRTREIFDLQIGEEGRKTLFKTLT